MRESTSIFKFVFVLAILSLGISSISLAAEASKEKDKDKTYQPEEEDFSSSPFAEYGEFNEEADEDADISFFQHGRFFGVSLGTGFEGITSNRGLLWNGGFPMIDFKVHYWFNFHVALDLGFFSAPHYFDTTPDNGGHVDASLMRIGADIKYYFDTKNLSSAISFANPYVLFGAGSFSKNQTSVSAANTESDSSMGISAGGGVEFAVIPKKIYLAVEGKFHFVSFKDTYTKKFDPPLTDLGGTFYTVTTGLMFTW